MASNIEKNFQTDLLNAGLRQDGRKFQEFRDMQLKFGNEYGNVQVTLGRTKLVVQVSAEVKPPRDSRPFEGLFHITTDISSMASPKFENGTSSTDEEVLVTRMVEKSIARSAALDLESLCIQAGKRCWMIRADVHYLQYDGGLIDASTFGVIAALLHFRKPDTSIEGDKVIIHSPLDRPPVPLSVLHAPISITWCFITLPRTSAQADGDAMDISDAESDSERDEQQEDTEHTIALLDCTEIEQDIKSGELVITVNKNRELCQFMKNGSFSLSSKQIVDYCERAYDLAVKFTNLIHRELKIDESKRQKGNKHQLQSAIAERDQ